MDTLLAPEVHDHTDRKIDLVQEPEVQHGTDMWRIARDSETLDVNSSYAYLVLCRDFRHTCRIAMVEGEVAGFVTGYVPAKRADTLFVWQVAVDDRYRGMGLASKMLDDLARSHDIGVVETTITSDNGASQRLFESFAERWNDAEVTRTPLFTQETFPELRSTEYLYTIVAGDDEDTSELAKAASAV
jgi:L-2,4-diaminobutyric acid acetyltransferase